ncbi:MAG TPA: Ppx/GppA phosphatase family protein [Clostridia bacterium]|nr:Ppx/GppA phosphatase family protein [Clostridia bacterium]
MRLAAIEIGTNSTKMIIVERNETGSYSTIRKCITVNRLSHRMFEKNIIQPEAFEGGLDIIRDYMRVIKENEAELVSIFSTSVLRDADNKDVFMQEVKSRTGCDIQIISGDTEAWYAYKAVSRLIQDRDGKAIVIDIGGGSTEVILGNREYIDQKISIDIGAVRLTELYCKNDPPTDQDISRISGYVKEKLIGIPSIAPQNAMLIGTGGTIKTLATIYSAVDDWDEKSINGMIVPRKAVLDIFQELAGMNIEARKKVKGLNPKRADVIITGLLILLSIFEVYEANEITISSYGVLEGLVEDYIGLHN